MGGNDGKDGERSNEVIDYEKDIYYIKIVLQSISIING